MTNKQILHKKRGESPYKYGLEDVPRGVYIGLVAILALFLLAFIL